MELAADHLSVQAGGDSAPTIPRFLRSIAARGARPAVRFEDEVLTYADLDRDSASLALGLLARGVGKGSRVGLLLGNGPRWAVAWAAVCRIGAVCVPLSTVARAPELARIVRHGDLALVLAQRSLLSQDFTELLPRALPSLGVDRLLRLPEAPYLRAIAVDSDAPPPWAWSFDDLRRAGEEAGFDDEHLRLVEAEVHPDDDAMIIYTSGQSADPKGVVHRHGAIVGKAHYLVEMLNVDESTEYRATMPFFWVGGLVLGLFTALAGGGVVLCTERTDGNGLVIGAATDVGNPNPEFRMASALGMTETFGMYSWGREWRVEGFPLCAPLDELQPGFEVKVVDDQGRVVGDGQRGELLVRGPALTTRLNKVDRSVAFDPDGYYRTGDQVLVDGDRLHFTGRLGDMIKSSGANVSPAEVERELLTFAGVDAAHVIGTGDSARGQVVVAAVVSRSGVPIDVEEIKRALRDRLSSYKVPREIVVLAPTDIPMTPSMKVRRRELREIIEREIAAR